MVKADPEASSAPSGPSQRVGTQACACSTSETPINRLGSARSFRFRQLRWWTSVPGRARVIHFADIFVDRNQLTDCADTNAGPYIMEMTGW